MSDDMQAFPVNEENHKHYGELGMTLRDYFAAKELSKVDCVSVCGHPAEYDRLADHCYRMADAMLKARKG